MDVYKEYAEEALWIVWYVASNGLARALSVSYGVFNH